MRRQLSILTVFAFLLTSVSLLWIPASSAKIEPAGWQALAEKIDKSASDPRLYQAIKLDNGMKVILVSDKDAPKSLAALALPVGSI